MALQYSDNTLLMQQILIDNLDNLGFSSISGHTIGNYSTGEPDGLLGEGTATALYALIAMSQHDLDPSERSTAYNEDTIVHIKDYMLENGVEESQVNTFIENAESLFVEGPHNSYGGADIDVNKATAELNLAEARRANGGNPVLIDPVVDADGIVQANGHVAALQTVLIDHLEALDLENITASDIGNSAGNPDDILGNGTSTALQQLALKAQSSIGGATPENTTVEYNEQTLENVKDYMLAAQVPEETVNAFIEEAKLLATDFRGAYVTASNVDVATLNVPDFSAVAEIESTDLTDNVSSVGDSVLQSPVSMPPPISSELEGLPMSTPDDAINYSPIDLDIYDPTANLQNSSEVSPVYGPSPESIGAPFQAANEQTGESLETQANTNGTVVMMTQGDYDALNDGGFLTDLEKAQVEAFPAALEAATQASGVEEAKAAYMEQMQRNIGVETYAVRQEAQGVMTEMNALRDSLMDTPMTFKVSEDGVEQEVTYTMREVDQMESDSWWDTSEEQANFDAGGDAFQELLDQNGYQELKEEHTELLTRATNGSVGREIREDQDTARQEWMQIQENLENNPISVTIPDETPEQEATLVAGATMGQ